MLIQNKYKEYLINEKKKAKQEDNKLRALSLLFKEVDEKEEENWDGNVCESFGSIGEVC